MISECKILKKFPESGQKEVVLAVHPQMGKIIIKSGLVNSFTSLERIKREVDLLSNLDSIYFPKQFSFNIDFNTKRFEIVEQYIEGKTLRDCSDLFTTKKEIFNLLKQIVSGLKIIWDENIVHRDLKPENIIIRPDNSPCIIDFGIAKFIDLDSLTKTISPIGPCTPVYASPEQLSNKKHLIDHRTDFFALGIICLELYIGKHPFAPKQNSGLYSIVENIMQNIYVTESDLVHSEPSIKEFANNTLQTQPYDRFRNYEMINNFIEEQI